VRRFRLSRSIGPDSLELAGPAGFAPEQPLLLRLRLPGADHALELAGAVVSEDGRELRFGDLDPDLRRELVVYLEERLGLT
jgi:hypothetical protein